jgi:hypothetical protein
LGVQSAKSKRDSGPNDGRHNVLLAVYNLPLKIVGVNIEMKPGTPGGDEGQNFGNIAC